jgi:hypothetical protein
MFDTALASASSTSLASCGSEEAADAGGSCFPRPSPENHSQLHSTWHLTADRIEHLPEDVLTHMARCLGTADTLALAQTSHELRRAATADVVWRQRYAQRFGRLEAQLKGHVYADYAHRSRYPRVGDKVEVWWMGNFTLVHDNVMTRYKVSALEAPSRRSCESPH